MEQIDETKERRQKTYTIIFIIIAILILAVIIFWYFWWGKSETKSTPIPTPVKSASKTPTPTPDPYQGFLTFNNNDFSYSIKYPSDAKITYLDAESLNEAQLTNEKVCTTIKTSDGYVVIRAAEAKEAAQFCGRTGVGQNYKNIADSVTIMGKSYKANGMYDDISQVGKREEFHTVSLDSGAGIEYGTSDYFNMSSTGPTFQELMAELKKIVESYQEN